MSIASQASVTERKKQLAQLAEMGIAVPDEFRGDMAMAGDWKVISQKPVQEATSEDPLSVGVRKRKFDGQEEEEEATEILARREWGSTSRRYPGALEADALNLDALLSGAKSTKKEEATPGLKEESEEQGALLTVKDEKVDLKTERETPTPTDLHLVNRQESKDPSESIKSSLRDIPTTEEALVTSVVFKKRKPKSTREK